MPRRAKYLPVNDSHFYGARSHSRLKIIIKTAITTKAIPAYNQLPVKRSTTMAMRVAGRKVIRLPTMNMMISSALLKNPRALLQNSDP